MGFRPLASLARPGTDQPAVELGQAAEHGDHEATLWRGRVGPGVANRAEGRTLAGDPVEDVEEIARRSSQAIEPRHHEHVAGVELGDRPVKLRPIGDRAGNLLLENLGAAGRAQSLDLSPEGLAFARHSGVAIAVHAEILPENGHYA